MSLSFILLRFLVVNIALVIALFLLWYYCLVMFQSMGWVLPASYAERQVGQFIAEQNEKDSLIYEDVPPLADYVLLDSGGLVLGTNASGGTVDKMMAQYHNDHLALSGYAQYSYPDTTTVLLRYRYVADFANENLRNLLPPYEYLSYIILAVLIIGGLLLTTIGLRRKLVRNLRLFGVVAQKVAQQDLDFTVPKADIKEFDAAMSAMDEMRIALEASLFTQWTAEQQRQAEISALAHDLKTPLTIISGNTELLLEDGLPAAQERMVKTIANNAGRAKRYISSMLSVAAGADEPFEAIDLSLFVEEIIHRAEEIAAKAGVQIRVVAEITGPTAMQFERLCRAITNIIQNAVEHTPAGQSVKISCESKSIDTWTVRVEDCGGGFSQRALRHATERFWREDAARSSAGHNGLGLWFANEVIKAHGGTLCLANGKCGGVVTVKILASS